MGGAHALVYLCRHLKHPAPLAGVERLAEGTRAEAWSHEEFLAVCLEREVTTVRGHWEAAHDVGITGKSLSLSYQRWLCRVTKMVVTDTMSWTRSNSDVR